jgi:hypothetical protein
MRRPRAFIFAGFGENASVASIVDLRERKLVKLGYSSVVFD